MPQDLFLPQLILKITRGKIFKKWYWVLGARCLVACYLLNAASRTPHTASRKPHTASRKPQAATRTQPAPSTEHPVIQVLSTEVFITSISDSHASLFIMLSSSGESHSTFVMPSSTCGSIIMVPSYFIRNQLVFFR